MRMHKFWMYIVLTIIGLVCVYFGYSLESQNMLMPGLVILMSLVAAYFYEFSKNKEEEEKKEEKKDK